MGCPTSRVLCEKWDTTTRTPWDFELTTTGRGSTSRACTEQRRWVPKRGFERARLQPRRRAPSEKGCHSEPGVKPAEEPAVPAIESILINPQFFSQSPPLPIHQRLRLRIHNNLIRPGPRKAFGRPLARGINAHLRPIVGQP